MKHFNLKSLTIGAALAGSLVAGNVYAAKDSHNLEEKTLCTLRWGGGRTLALQGFNDAGSMGTFNEANGGNGRIYLERTKDGKYLIGGQGLFITGIEAGQQVTVGAKADAIAFDVEGDAADNGNHDLYFSHEGLYLVKGGGNNDIQGSTEKPGTAWRFNNESLGDNRYKAQLDDGQQFNVNGVRYSVVMFPFAVSAPEGKTFYKYDASYDGELAEGSYAFVSTTELPAGEPGIYKTTDDDGDLRLNISYTNADKIAIAEYVDQPKTIGNFITGFYSKPGYNPDGAKFFLGVKDGKYGFYKDLVGEGNNANINNGAYKNNQTNIAYLLPNADVPYYTLEEAEGVLILKAAAQTEVIIDECVALVTQLKALKENVGTEPGQYNVTNDALGSDYDAIWNALDNYDEATDKYYLTNKGNETTLLNWKATLESMIEKVKATFVLWPLDLAEVEIVTLQWGGSGQYSGINGGGKWENPGAFNGPNGGNGRIALIQKEEDKYYISSQGLFLKVTEEGQRVTADSRADATAFITTRTSENGLTFVTEDGWYLTGSQFAPSQDEPQQDYRINTFGNYANVSVADGATECDGIFYSSLVLPYKVQKPEAEGYHTFVFSQNGNTIEAKDVDVVPAGVPFLYVGPSNGDAARMPIPQDGQEYNENISTDHVLDGFLARIEGDELKALQKTVFSLSVNDGKIGYFLNGGFTETTPANRGYISLATADALNAAAFELDYNAADGTLKVNIVKTVSVTIGKAGWATLYSDRTLDFSETGLTAYTATVSDNTVTLTEVQNVPAGTGVVLNGADGDYDIPVIASSNTAKGDLKGSATEELTNSADATMNYFVLTKNAEDKVQFAQLADDATIPAGKAYLELPKGDGARVLSVVFEGETTGIVDANREATADGRIYNLNGQSVAQPAKGLYIVNGKKVVIR